MTFNKSILDVSLFPLVRFWLIMTLNIISVVQNRVMKVKAQSWQLLLHQVALTPENGFINLSRNCSAEKFTWISMTCLISVNFFQFLRFNVAFKWKLFFLYEGLFLAHQASWQPRKFSTLFDDGRAVIVWCHLAMV